GKGSCGIPGMAARAIARNHEGLAPGDGLLRRPGRLRRHNRECTAQKKTAENRAHLRTLSLPPRHSYSGKPQAEGGVTPFRPLRPRRHKPQRVAVIPATKLRFLQA